MKKILILSLIIFAAGVAWKKVPRSDGDDALADLSRRLEVAERSFQQAGRAAGMAGVDTTADAAGALREVAQVERELRELKSRAGSAEEKRRIESLLDRAGDLRRRMG